MDPKTAYSSTKYDNMCCQYKSQATSSICGGCFSYSKFY